jgi:uncharacterized protein with GYD domain
MAKYILLIDWTEQGVKAAKESPGRADKARELARSVGANMEQLYLVMGDHDFVCVLEAPDDAVVATFVVKLAMGGNVRTKTLKAFTEDEYRRIMGAL